LLENHDLGIVVARPVNRLFVTHKSEPLTTDVSNVRGRGSGNERFGVQMGSGSHLKVREKGERAGQGGGQLGQTSKRGWETE
jgi:hypothetical protein